MYLYSLLLYFFMISIEAGVVDTNLNWIILIKFVSNNLTQLTIKSFFIIINKMGKILIADSGSTKTDWCLLYENGKRLEFKSIGMNPYNVSIEEIADEMTKVVLPFVENNIVSHLYFYGAGCSSKAKKDFMKIVFSEYFPSSHIEIKHDLMGACRALCGNEKGIVGILGTGSNSCLYDGKDILENVPSLGYVLCDEGAGSTIGKTLLRLYLRNEFPSELQKLFKSSYPGTENDFLDQVYKRPLPNRFLASFTPFAHEHREHPYMKLILKEIFSDYFKHQIVKYTDYNQYKLSIIGSVAFFFLDEIKDVATQYNIKIGSVLKAPMQGLIEYHKNS